MNPMHLVTKAKNFIAPHVPTILIGAAVGVASAVIVNAVVNNNDEDDSWINLNFDIKNEMDKRNEALLLRNPNGEEYILYKLDPK